MQTCYAHSKIETVKVHDLYLARPTGALGNCGYSPFPWTATYGVTSAQAIIQFIENHKKHLTTLEG